MDQKSLSSLGDQIRNNCSGSDRFNGPGPGRDSGSWWPSGWSDAGSAYGAVTYVEYSGYSDGSSGYSSQPVYYDFGTNVVYQGDTVYVNGDAAGTQAQYAQEASAIADTGRQAAASTDEEWRALGVFALAPAGGGQGNSNDLFQLAINNSGTIRGNYYSALSNTTLPVYGSVDPKTQRAAWTIAESSEPVYEAGVANLTKSETTALVHFGKGRTQQWTLVRLEQPTKSR